MAELSNRTDELLFGKHSKYERGVIQGKAQALMAIINLPDELQQLKSIEDIEKQRREQMQKELEEYDGSEMVQER